MTGGGDRGVVGRALIGAEAALGDRRTDRALWAVAVGAAAADLALTALGTRIGLHEGNPAAHAVVALAGVRPLAGVAVLKLLALALGAGCWLALPDRTATVVPFGLAVPTVAAVCNNLVLLGLTVGG
jgi:hypothetical protein